jgi:DNA invertase Pin-like site-specific DNA recombinase
VLRAVLLGRVSSRKSSQETSLPRQGAELSALARRKGWVVVGWHFDRITGATLDRPGLQAALDDLARGRADVLVVADLDRLGRDAREMLATIDAIHSWGKGFYAMRGEIDGTGAAGRLVFSIFASVSEFFSRAAGEKIRAGLAHARAEGRIGGRPRLLDYAKLPRARALRRRRASWSQIATELGGTRNAWARAVSRAAVTKPLRRGPTRSGRKGPIAATEERV